MARISIITVVRNGAQDLEETIQSVLVQKNQVDLDYLIVDGGSTDGTVEIIRRHAEELLFWVSAPDSGIYDAMNKGWAAASPDSLILFLGSGDMLISLPDGIGSIGRKDDDVLYGNVWMGERFLFKGAAGFRLRFYNTLHHQALLVNKRCHPAPPFNTGFKTYADFDFNQRLMKAGARFIRVPGFVSYARPGGLSDHTCFRESLKVTRGNFGVLWAGLAAAAYVALKVFPALKVLRPIKKVPQGGKDA